MTCPNRMTVILPGLLGLCALASSPGLADSPSTRIFGGEDADQGAWPWMALLAIVDPAAPRDGRNVRTFRCGGILINQEYVLTAAHCLFNTEENPPMQAEEIWISYDQIEAPTRLNDYKTYAAEIIVHPDYDEYPNSDLSDDIALLRLHTAATLSAFPVLASSQDIDGLEILTASERDDITTALGWGVTEEGGVSSTLQQVALDYILRGDCNNAWRGIHISDKMVCAAETDPPDTASDGQDTCFGDSGGPLLIDAETGTPVSIGITSFGTSECGNPDPPSVYTNVAFYHEWIDGILTGKTPAPAEPEPEPDPEPDNGATLEPDSEQEEEAEAPRASGSSSGFSIGWLLLALPLLGLRRRAALTEIHTSLAQGR